MADAIAVRAGEAARGDLSVNEDLTVSHGSVKGTSLAASHTGEVVLALDWTKVNGLFFAPYHPAYEIAAAVVRVFADPSFWPELGLPTGHSLADLPIHLVGHSRGGSVVSSLAYYLGVLGLWVDQVTTLDPHPVDQDPEAVVWDNTVFADNYYHTDSLGPFDPYGTYVAHAFNNELTYATPDIYHSDVHAYYHGTIDTFADSDQTGRSIFDSWYSTDPWGGGRSDSGFRYSLLGKGVRWSGDGSESSPRGGLNTLFGGSATRPYHVDPAPGVAQWPNVADIRLDKTTVQRGEYFTANIRYKDTDSGAQAWVYLDTDLNPYNGSTGAAIGYTTLGSISYYDLALTCRAPTSGQGGALFLYAVVSDGPQTRYVYATQMVTVVSLPDLAVSSVTGARSTYGPGERVQVSAAIRNQGAADAAPFTASFYLGKDDPSTLRWVGNAAFSAGLTAGASGTGALDWAIPGDVAPGAYRIWVKADSYSVVAESSESNNYGLSGQFTYSDARPDLTVPSVSGARAWYTIGEQIEVKATVANRGAAPAAPFTVSYYLVPRGGTPSAGNWIQNAVYSGGLGAGVSWPDTLDAWKSPTGTTPGFYRIWAVADSYKVITESSESNNTGTSAEFQISADKPDLTVTKITGVLTSYTLGQKVQAAATIKNLGPGSAGIFTAAFWLSKEDGTILKRLDDDPDAYGLGPGAGTTYALGDGSSPGWTISGIGPGRYRIMVQADAYNALPEVSEGNNWGWSGVFTVGAGLMAGGGPGATGGFFTGGETSRGIDQGEFHADPLRRGGPELFDESIGLDQAAGPEFFAPWGDGKNPALLDLSGAAPIRVARLIVR